ncbi:MAG: YcxB family protein [Oscillospiraceae bacterium]|nr:YcxB family protein [Oscillospiraceae bacterium]
MKSEEAIVVRDDLQSGIKELETRSENKTAIPGGEAENAANMFEASTRYEYQDYLALNRVFAKTYRRWSARFVRLFLFIAGSIFSAISLLFLVGDGFVWDWLYILLMGVIFLLLSVFYHYANALQSKRLTVRNMGEIRYIFREDCFFIDCKKGKSMIPYAALESILRYKDRYFLCNDRRHAYVLPRCSFVCGDTAEFEAFLSEKTGREWNVVKAGKRAQRRLREN